MKQIAQDQFTPINKNTFFLFLFYTSMIVINKLGEELLHEHTWHFEF